LYVRLSEPDDAPAAESHPRLGAFLLVAGTVIAQSPTPPRKNLSKFRDFTPDVLRASEHRPGKNNAAAKESQRARGKVLRPWELFARRNRNDTFDGDSRSQLLDLVDAPRQRIPWASRLSHETITIQQST
jgi:hypothetical protein